MSDSISDAISTEPAAAGDALPGGRAGWGFWSTAAWGLGTFLVSSLAPLPVIFAVLRWRDADAPSVASFDAALHSGALVVATLTFSSLPVTFLLLALAARLARVPVAEYLALKPVGARTIGFAVACAIAYAAASDMSSYAAGRGLTVPWVQTLYATGREGGLLGLVWLAVLVAAPVGEELMFRGFLFRGWAASRLRVPGTIVLTSALWAGTHLQYDWVTMGGIFGLGLLFGYLRARSGSSIPTIVAHSAYGLAAMIQAMIIAR
jgi:membrane protease YdiL (CAAX protease family)